MPELDPPCFTDDCSYAFFTKDQKQSPYHQNLCVEDRQCLIDAGGAGLLEIFPCPYKAVRSLESRPDNQFKAEMRRRLRMTQSFEHQEVRS